MQDLEQGDRGRGGQGEGGGLQGQHKVTRSQTRAGPGRGCGRGVGGGGRRAEGGGEDLLLRNPDHALQPGYCGVAYYLALPSCYPIHPSTGPLIHPRPLSFSSSLLPPST